MGKHDLLVPAIGASHFEAYIFINPRTIRFCDYFDMDAAFTSPTRNTANHVRYSP